MVAHTANMNRGRLVIAEATVTRGFTTVRATGGDISGLVRAIDSGLCDGPRMVRAGRAISQTGGHGDFTPNAPGGDLADTTLCACEVHGNRLGHVADGPDAVRKAVRTELRAGSDFIKIMSSRRAGLRSPPPRKRGSILGSALICWERPSRGRTENSPSGLNSNRRPMYCARCTR